MLEPRLYRVAFVPVLLALLVAAFSLQDRPRPIGTTQAPEAFDEIRADQTLDDLARRFPVRRPGDAADTRLAGEIATRLRQTVPGTVEEHHFQGDTIDGERDLIDVVATRPGGPGPADRRRGPPRCRKARLQGRAVGDRRAAGARARRRRRAAAPDHHLHLDHGRQRGLRGRAGGGAADGAAAPTRSSSSARSAARRPGGRSSSSLSNGRGQAPIQLQRTVQAAVRAEVGTDAGAPRALTQWLRMAVPVTISEQGPFLRAGQPAVLLSASGERPPAADDPIRDGRMLRFGRASLRVLYALDNFRDLAQPPRDDLSSAARCCRAGRCGCWSGRCCCRRC